ncbi:MAG: hypothetical protein H0W88_11810 [Parachlamydiaceae bacterium]|nr:hypothetical protein [Parachlamydiaceae bacterium]
MDENTWGFAQLMMWLIGIQSGFLITVLGSMWAHFNNRFEKIDHRFEKMEERQLGFENVMIEVKAILRMKHCCMIKDNRQIKKVE